MNENSFHGVFPYLISPIDEAGAVMKDVLALLCRDLIDAVALYDLCRQGEWSETLLRLGVLDAAGKRRSALA